MLQSRNRLENRQSENDEISRRVWKAVEARSGKIRMGKTEEGGSKRRSRKKMGGKGKNAKAEERKDDGSKENSRGMENLG